MTAKPTPPPAAANEPVAWRWHWLGGDEPDVWAYSDFPKETDEHRYVEPLYLAPPPSQVEQAPVQIQVPLSAERLAQWKAHVETVEREYDKGNSVPGVDALTLAARLRRMLSWVTPSQAPVETDAALNFTPPQGAGGRDAAGTGERIVRAAVERGNAVYSVPQPGRHGDVFKIMPAADVNDGDQGFLTSTGRFVDRTEARQIAERAGQLLPGVKRHRELFSEDVWETPEAVTSSEGIGPNAKAGNGYAPVLGPKEITPKPAPKPVLRFKVGDKVRFVKAPKYLPNNWIGKEGVVDNWGSTNADGHHFDYRINADAYTCSANDSDLEPAEAEPTLTRADVRREFIALIRELREQELKALAELGVDSPRAQAAHRLALSRMEAGK